MYCKYLIIGGGIAGISCATCLQAHGEKPVVVSASPIIKAVRNVKQLTRSLASFDVEETSIKSFTDQYQGITVIHDMIQFIDFQNKTVQMEKEVIKYEKVCICTGARPKTPFPSHPRILTIRDTGSIKLFESQLVNSKKMVLVGNGGIATELAFQIKNCQIIWVIRESSIGNLFFDSGAAEFFLPLLHKKNEEDQQKTFTKRMNFKLMEGKHQNEVTGSALGPDWHQAFNLNGCSVDNVDIHYKCHVINFRSGKDEDDWAFYVELSNGIKVGCDFMVSATGVVPNTELFPDDYCKFDGDDGGVLIDTMMKVVGLEDVYAAGDVCCTKLWPDSKHWFQMRLWTQAKQMGEYSARCMLDQVDLGLDLCFDLFTHVTNFFGKKVVLLGRFNLQGIDKEEYKNAEILLRMTKDEEYIKVILLEGRILGSVLIGETDYEETFENLILNQIDVSYLGSDLINPDIDITDYFD